MKGTMKVCLFLSYERKINEQEPYEEHFITVFEMFKVGDERPIGKIRTYNLGFSVERNKYADWHNFISYPYGGIVLIEPTKSRNANGTYYRFIDYENNRDDMNRSLANLGYGRELRRNFYDDYKINIHFFTRSTSVNEWFYNDITNQCNRSFMNTSMCRIMEFSEIGPLPECVITVRDFRDRILSLDDKEYVAGVSIDGIFIKFIDY